MTQPRKSRAARGGRGVFAAAFLAAASFAAGLVAASIPRANRILPHPATLRGTTDRSSRANQYTTPLTPGVVNAHSARRARRGVPRAAVMRDRKSVVQG